MSANTTPGNVLYYGDNLEILRIPSTARKDSATTQPTMPGLDAPFTDEDDDDDAD